MNLKIYPEHTPPGGIGSVLEDHRELLNHHTFVQNERDADLIMVHASASSQQSPDITYTHGLYATQDTRWSPAFHQVNQRIFTNIANSLQAVSVSQWGGALIKRYCGIEPHIIHNGIFYSEYKRGGQAKGPALWGKTTINPVCDPTDFNYLTERFKDPFVSFLDLPRTKTIQTLLRKEMRRFLQTCSLLIATSKENDSLLIMEAMACGVPVLAYDWGMARDRLTHKQGCYLATPHNLTDLCDGYQYLKKNWQLQSEIAHTVAGWFDWELQKPKLEQLFAQTLQEKQAPARVSIVIPCHNYSTYVDQAIQSAKDQTVKCEVIVVEDASTDDSLHVIQAAQPDKVIVHTKNKGLARSRNEGIQQASGNFIVCLDADDTLEPTYVQTLLTGFTKRNVAICFTPLQLVDATGKRIPQLMFTRVPNPQLHKQGLNQVPCGAMFKKSWWQRVDGYDPFLPMSEDANLWLKMFLIGGTAVKASSQPLFNYRRHDKNHSFQPMPTWNIFHEQKVIADDSFSIVVIDDEEAKAAYWRLKELPYAIQLYTETIKSRNYIILSPTADIKDRAQEKINSWIHQFLYQPESKVSKT